MVAFTPNRGYPYSEPSDPADIPQAIQDLAEAIDIDMQLLSDSIVARPMAYVRSVSADKQIFPAEQTTEATYDFIEVDTASISDLSNKPTRLTPTSSGLWMVWGSIEVPDATYRTRDVFLRKNGVDITRSEYHVTDPTSVSPVAMTLAGIEVMNGTTDYFTMTLNPDQATADFKIGNKRLACWRLVSI